MKMGLTYDLRSEYLQMGYSSEETSEFDRDDTIDAIETALSDLGHQTDRIGNGRRLVERLARGDRWDLVFNIAEGLNGMGREAQVPGILDLYHIPYTFSDPLVMTISLHKAMAKRIVRDSGLATSCFFVFEKPADAGLIDFDPPYFIKPIAEGTGKGTSSKSIIHHRETLGPACHSLLRQYRQPVLVEPFLPGREFTVGILGSEDKATVLGAIEVDLLKNAEPGVYSYANKENSEERVRYHLVEGGDDPTVLNAEALSLSVYRVLGCRDAGRIDIRCDEYGNPMFMEINPLAGLHPDHSDLPIICNHLGLSYLTLIQRIVESAAARCK